MRTPRLAIPLTPTMPAPAKIEAARGIFESGHTSEDVQAVLEPLSEFLGYKIAVAWAFMDCYGCGGDSELMVIDEQGRFYEAPSDLVTFLYEPDNTVSIDCLKADGLSKRETYRGRKTWEETEYPHNYTRRVYDGQAPKF